MHTYKRFCGAHHTPPYRSFPPEHSPSYFPRFPFRPPCRHSRIAPSHRSPPQALSHGFPSVHPVVIPVYRSFPPELSPSYFTRFPFRPPSHHSRIAPSERSSPQAISHSFPSVHPVVIPVSLLPTGALPKLFPTASLPSTLSSLPYRSFPPELSPCISHGFLSVHPIFPYRSFPPELSPSYFPRFPFRPPCHSRIAPSHRSSPQTISHGFPSVHPVVTPVSLLPTGALPKLFPTVSFLSTLSSLPYRSFPPELSPCMLFPTVSLPSTLSSFPYIAPSHRSSPQAISHSFPCRHSRIAPSHRSSPQLFPTVSLPSTLSSLPYRSFPPEHSPSYFPRFPFRPSSHHSRIAPSHRSSPQAISHGFPSVHPLVASVSLLPLGALPRLFPTVSPPSTLSSLPSESRSFPTELLFPTVSPPSTQSSLPSVPSQRSSPQAISHGFPSVHPLVKSVSLPRGECN